MDRERFYNAVLTVTSGEHIRAGIGTYGEKTVHAVLKNYFEPFQNSHEQKIGGYVADIIGESGIIEIQTAGFDKLRKKLEAFLAVSCVTVVYPAISEKWIISVNPETGETGKKRKSPHKGSIYDVFPELYKIKRFLSHENFKLCIVMLDADEYRFPPEKTGLKRGRRKGYIRYDRVPCALTDEIYIEGKSGWKYFIPAGLEDGFTSSVFAKKAKITESSARLVLNILTETGTVLRVGKTGNSFVYNIV